MATEIDKGWPQAEEETDCLFCRKSESLPPQDVSPQPLFSLWKRTLEKTTQTKEAR